MSRTERAKHILSAAEKWRDCCLIDEGSVFSDGPLWTKENYGALRRHYVDNLNYGDGTFFQKLKAQLELAPPEAKKLASEMLWVMYLVIAKSSMSAETKRFQVRDVWGWSGDSLDENLWVLQEPLEDGVCNPGTAYHTHRWREFRYFVTTMIDWFELNADQREDLLGDPWKFAQWLGEREFAKGRQLRHALLFLLFPDTFESILSNRHKKDIVKNFNSHWDTSPEIDYSDLIAVDREVLAVRERAEDESSDTDVYFYKEPYRSIWQKNVVAPIDPPDPSKTDLREVETWYQEKFGNARVWALAAGDGGRLWPSFQQDNLVAVGWEPLGDFTQYESKEDVRKALIDGGETNPVMDTHAVWQFLQEIKPGDIVIIKRGRSGLLGWGVIQDEYEYDPNRPEYRNIRHVEWRATDAVDLPRDRQMPVKALTDMSRDKDWVFYAFGLIEGWGVKPPDKTLPPSDLYTVSDAMEDLFLPTELFTRILGALNLRKNLILQGPPGVGKTFIAKRIAWSLIGQKTLEPIEMVQFHQSYAYEDFVQGWRPTESGGFKLRNGVFHEFCSKAAANPDIPHVFIIDEINRGNLSRIFGELLMLIEADKRGPDHTIPLIYSQDGERFSVPENIHILGMMNTADRSIAMVDYALRRRFAFVSLKPAFGTEPFQQYLLDAGADPSLVKLIDERLLLLNEKIRSDAKNLGPGFEIGHSYFVPSNDDESLDENWFRNIVHTQIEPLLREYWFDQPQAASNLLSDLLP